MNNDTNNLKVVTLPDGTVKHYLNDFLHNDNGPAVIYDSGTREWYQHGQLHRKDGPAVEHYNNIKEWYLNGQLHRDNGPAIEGKDNLWFQHGILHREDGPALEVNGGSDGNEWYKNGLRHREDGPAVIYSNDVQKWHLEGQEYSKEAFEKEMVKRISSKEKSFNSVVGNIVKNLREKFFSSESNKPKNKI